MLETQELVIRGFRPSDWRDLYEYLSDETVVLYEPYGVFSKRRSKAEARKRAKSNSYFAVCLKPAGKLIGNLYFKDQGCGTYELGYVFGRKYQGRGYATQSVKALLSHAFCQMSARRVIAMCNPVNVRSWKLLERIGMRREGHLVQNIYFRTDEKGEPVWQDTYMYAILATEWNFENGV